MTNLQFRFGDYVFRPSLTGALILIICIPLFIKLGYWQYSKAEQKQALQLRYDAYQEAVPVAYPTDVIALEEWRYRPIKVSGEYLAQYQILLDNQVEAERAGYHVITPLKLAGREEVVLVDRGWIAATDNHSEVPQVEAPAGPQELLTRGWVPSQKFYTLGKPDAGQRGQWQVLWQNMDMAAYQSAVPFKVMPLLLRLAPENTGGFVRNWLPPAERITTHIGYAYQWFGFAVAALAIYLFVSFKKVSK